MPPVLTTVGSLPPPATSAGDPLAEAVELQRAHGIRVFTDGEPRGDMLSLYTELPGIREGRGIPRVVGRICPMEDPSAFTKVRDLDRLRSRYPEARFKVSLTGPASFLLASAAGGAGPAYRGPMDPALHDDLTEALRPIAREIGRRGAYLQLDEPILSQGMRDYGPSMRRLDLVASELSRERASLHVCGGLRKANVLEALLRLERISVLNLAFAGRLERENKDLLEPRPWADRGILLGAGCIDVQVSRREEVMDPEAVESLLRLIVSRIGADWIAFVLPDCGLRATAPPLVAAILENLHRGAARVFPELT